MKPRSNSLTGVRIATIFLPKADQTGWTSSGSRDHLTRARGSSRVRNTAEGRVGAAYQSRLASQLTPWLSVQRPYQFRKLECPDGSARADLPPNSVIRIGNHDCLPR